MIPKQAEFIHNHQLFPYFKRDKNIGNFLVKSSFRILDLTHNQALYMLARDPLI